MPTTQSQLDYILDQLSFLPNLTIKKMFGEYAFYSDSKYLGLICDYKVFLKTNKDLIAKIGDDGLQAYKNPKFNLHIAYEVLEDKVLLIEVFGLV